MSSQTSNTNNPNSKDPKSFQSYDLSLDLLRAIYEMGFDSPSRIQQESIPPVLAHKHVLARAKNGTGKTAAFAIPSIAKIDFSSTAVQMVVLLPSHELAQQTFSVFGKLCRYLPIRLLLLIGGSNFHDNIRDLSNTLPHIVIGTPGRVCHLVKEKHLTLQSCSTFVLDEADYMVTAHFADEISHLISLTSKSRHLLLYSATFPMEIKQFAERWMPDVVMINTIGKDLTLKGITPFYIKLEEKEKLKAIFYLLKTLNINQSIAFCSSVQRVEALNRALREEGVSCSMIHSQMAQSTRTSIYEQFRRGQSRHLIASDIFTRGIDIGSVNVVINFDFPSSTEIYLHRVGRSGRFGQKGLSIDLVTPDDKLNFYTVEAQLNLDIDAIPVEIDQGLYV